MTTTPNSLDALIAVAGSLGLDADDLRRAADGVDGTSTVPVVAAYVPRALETMSDACRHAYRPGLLRLVDEHGDTRLDRVTTQDLVTLRDRIIADAAAKKIANAERSGRPLRSYERSAHGYGAGENAVRGFRYLYRSAINEGIVVGDPAIRVKVPKRLPAPERPLLAWELEELASIWCTTGNDPRLDSLLLEFHRKSAARRVGALNLRLAHLDRRIGAVTLTEKFGKTRVQPLDVDLIDRLEEFARSRGASKPSDHVFRNRSGTPMTRRRYETIYERTHKFTTWTRMLEVGVHWIRHTTLDDVRLVAGVRVAAAYAGHDDASLGTIGGYSKVPFEQLVWAYEQLFGPRGVQA
jgi:site-specific recombinase XerD